MPYAFVNRKGREGMQNQEVTGTMKGEATENLHTSVSPAPEICGSGT
jgi:hypothetical protein